MEASPRAHRRQNGRHDVGRPRAQQRRRIATIFVVAVADLDLDPEVAAALLAPAPLGRPHLPVLGTLADVAHVPTPVVVRFLYNFATH